MQDAPPTRKYTAEEKQHILANLDIEVSHRVRTFESQLADTLENYRIHAEGQVSRVPKQLRSITMAEFIDKYQGDLQAALRGVQKEALEKLGATVGGELDRAERKRKWISNLETTGEAEAGSSTANKFPRTGPSPRKKAPATPSRSRIAAPKTPGTARQVYRQPSIAPSPSPAKRPLAGPSSHPFRPTSPSKNHPHNGLAATSNGIPQRSISNPHPIRPPSSTFNPVLPSLPANWRLPRKNESFLSLNGSPLANPFAGSSIPFSVPEEADEGGSDGGGFKGPPKASSNHTLKRSSSFVLRKDARTPNGLHARTSSQPSLFGQPSAHPQDIGHMRTWSQSTAASSATGPPTAYSSDSGDGAEADRKLRPLASAMVTVPLADGQVLEFDPLQASPGALDALEGITDSAKKHARDEMIKFVEAAVQRWKIA
ncbi:hypothetical protein PUNSTDRAFT_50013 [Punctularia strigosozonata HHB-11173 SS5]|uniref:uncharacterized protein n=1 Tax=Punctularia strigosozonata (strain HHB-11173) TaxID=741275 RepID=UPI000441845D|nr:uncharacterized protein PUNSTDRAFT_50013 [Punctularia strigosozonata HHB-11173 SS5]EIN12773.1 hypothetical protein PUNSTDRAFT_50013 [Punctularia strigosozonata HHB-11173 SS5]